ncbi:Xaa-Pro peptidase family protein [Petrotoga sp. 9PWA.NaAc.5.4]|uniref:M24 family metallopeptidase n=1 Tax=Petrotoga sp. 9PWA.NaAc.5.4 TaxID=1434328 RepID=UPI000CAFD365|nr:aminopeptidase P family protein [Petrotoga sp. 9PWA.NaAc.5.4]PNR94736.1 proline dipeptidase [Petrotoga sp. 9PWA.NaAc.5.4]
MKEQRLNEFLDLMRKQNIHQVIITSTPSLYYFLGEWIEPGERLLAFYVNIFGETKLILNEMIKITNLKEVDIINYSDSQDPIIILSQLINKDKTIGIEEQWRSGFLLDLLKIIGTVSVFQNITPLISKLRMKKDSEEIELMQASSIINDSSMEKVISVIPEMLPEKYLAKAIKNIFEREGADEVSFEPIVAYGKNASDPHHIPQNTKIKDGEAVLIDMGCIKDHYCSDMTRTVFFGNPIETLKNIYQIVLEANLKAIEKVKPGVMAYEVDDAARSVINQKGYGQYFIHRTGHGVGLEIHEMPYISQNSQIILEAGMIFSIEPGIYLPGVGGVRIEDLVLVTDDGCRVLNKFPKELTII